MDQPKIERLLKLMELLTGSIDYSITELSEKLQMSPRTIYRYIDTFRSAGFVVAKREKGFTLAKDSRFFKDISQLVHFTEEEAFMINKLIDGLDSTNIIKENLRAKLATIYDITSIADVVVKKENASNVNRLIEAIEEGKQVVLKAYRSSKSNTTSDRLVEPFKFTTNYIDVICFDTKDNTNKLFKTERIGDVEILERPQRFQHLHNAGFIDIFRMHTNLEPIHIVLEMGTLAHNLLIEEYPLSEKYIKKKSEKRWVLSVDVANLKGIARFVIGTMDDIEIIDGEELKDYIRDYVKKYLKDI